MKRVLFVVGLIVLVIGSALYLAPAALSALANDTGVSVSVVSNSQTLVLNVSPDNYTSEKVTLGNNDNLNVSYQSEPAGIEFLLMNQSSYSQFVSGAQSNVSVYAQSRLGQANNSFSFMPSATNVQEYYLVFKALAGRNVTTDLLLNYKIQSQVTAFNVLFIPYAIFVIALILLGIGIFGGRRRNVTQVSSTAASRKAEGASLVAQPTNDAICKFCYAPMPSSILFCPSCGRSQN